MFYPKRTRTIHLFSMTLMLCLILSILTIPTVGAQESISALPTLASFERARFHSVTTVDLGDIASQNAEGTYGQGSIVLPDQGITWLNTPGTPSLITGIVRTDDQVYVNSDGEWRLENNESYRRANEFETSFNLVAQLEQLAVRADTVTNLGQVDLAGVPTNHYQFWVPETAVLEVRDQSLPEPNTVGYARVNNTTYKYDLWIDADGRVRQQNIVQMQRATTATLPNGELITLDAREISFLITYKDLNDPAINIAAPTS